MVDLGECPPGPLPGRPPWRADPAQLYPFPLYPPVLLPSATRSDKYDIYCSEWGCFVGAPLAQRAWEQMWPTMSRCPAVPAAPLTSSEDGDTQRCTLLPGRPIAAPPWLTSLCGRR